MLRNAAAIARDISDWMKKFMEDIGKNVFVIGVSGGIDSAVAFRLAQATGLETQPVFLPSGRAQSEELMSRVNDLLSGGDHLPLITNEIDQIVSINTLLPIYDEDKRNKALGNLSARTRMAILYYYAELTGGIVLGTTNLPEWHLGYFTKWGDGAVDIEPLRSFLKSEVFQLGREGFSNPVPDSILNAAPSAGLWEGQTDEDEMGFTYGDVDAYLSGCKIPQKSVEKIEKLHRITQHKREESPFF